MDFIVNYEGCLSYISTSISYISVRRMVTTLISWPGEATHWKLVQKNKAYSLLICIFQVIFKTFIRLSGADRSSGQWSCILWCYLWSGIGRFHSDQEHLHSRWRPPGCQQFLRMRGKKEVIVFFFFFFLKDKFKLECYKLEDKVKLLSLIMIRDEMRLRGDFKPML